MIKTKIEAFDIIGISTRTINDGSAATDIPALWGRFMNEKIQESIPNRVDDTIYCLYTNYAGDHTQPYDVIIGCKVSTLENVPANLITHTVEQSDGMKFQAKGSLEKGEAVVSTWYKIWESGLDRSFTTDFEVYDERSADMHNAEVDILISIN